jgi:hypothetical protein
MNAPSSPEQPRLPIIEEVGTELHRLFRAEEESRAGAGNALRLPIAAARAASRYRAVPCLRWMRERPRLLVLLFVVLVAATGAAAAVSLSGERTASVPLPGGAALCPAGFEYLAYAKPRRVYPPNYPGALPRNARGTSCYVSEQAAENAGYTIAPPPPGDARIGPLYVADAPTAVLRACERARRLGVAVYCPRRLPAPWNESDDCPRAQCPVFKILGAFSAPSGYVGGAPGEGDLSVWAAPRAQRATFGLGCAPGAQPISRTLFHEHSAAWYSCPIFAGLDGIVLQWQVGREVYGVTVSGHASINRRLVQYVAAHLRRLAPTP